MKLDDRLSDSAKRAADAFMKGRIDRRRFLRICAAAGVAPAILAPQQLLADDLPSKIVHANWGGDAARCYGAVGTDFQAQSKIPLAIDGSGPTMGRIKQMVETKNVVWDVFDNDLFYGLELGRQGLLEPIDYSIVQKSKIANADKYALQYAVAGYWYSNAIAYDTTKTGGQAPNGWADFWDVKKYPGKRATYKYCVGVLESALMADGVAMESLYPLDIDRALKKIKELKDHLVFWSGGAESQQMLVQGDVVMAQVWHNRATVLERQTSGRITWTWNQATIGPGGWAIPKGNPAGAEWANRWIAYMQDPKEQLGVLDCMGFAPANGAAWDLETEAQRRLDPTRPENAKLQVPIDEAFYADHYDEMLNRFTDLISS